MFVLYKAKISGERLQDHWSSGCIKLSEKSILERNFDVLFWHNFVLIFLHRRTKIISIYILVPEPSVNNYSIMAEN